jgi:hypothetical protein
MTDKEKNEFLERQLSALQKIHELHEQVKDIDLSLSKLYPVAIVKNDTFFVFDLDTTKEKYEFKLEHPTPMLFPKGVLASFPLEFYNMKPSAVITEDAFETQEGYAFIFHEFVHCFQWENGETEIRANLKIEQKSKEENNYMWEITHPFPYENSSFIEKTIALDNLFNTKDYNGVCKYYKEMNQLLTEIDFEYMIWQEWKEGYARYIENQIRDRLGLNKNINILKTPLERVCFYHIGSRYIDLLMNTDTNLKGNIKDLYYRMVSAS